MINIITLYAILEEMVVSDDVLTLPWQKVKVRGN